MKRPHLIFSLIGLGAISLLPPPLHADQGKLSPERLDVLDKRGYFTPAFKAAVRDLVNARQATSQAKSEEQKLTTELPALKKQSEDDEAKTTELRNELEKYSHPDNIDFANLQARMNDPSAKPEDLLPLVQAYVWTYPASPHQTEAQQDLQQIQKKIADQAQADKEAEAARAAAREKLVQRAMSKDLSLAEWKDFLRDMSQADVMKYLGQPGYGGADYWVYSGAWIVSPATGLKTGLQVNFNGTRVSDVVVGPVAQ